MKKSLIFSLIFVSTIVTMDDVENVQESKQKAITDFKIFHHQQPGGINRLEFYMTVIGKERFNSLLQHIEGNKHKFFNAINGSIDENELIKVFQEGAVEAEKIENDTKGQYQRSFYLEKFLSFQPPNAGQKVELLLNDYTKFKDNISAIFKDYYPHVTLTDELYRFLFKEINRLKNIQSAEKNFDFLDLLNVYKEQSHQVTS